MLESAWWHAVLSKVDGKKFPNKPSLLWDKDSDRQTPMQMAALAVMLADNGSEFKESLAKTVH